MKEDLFLNKHPNDPTWGHNELALENNISIHYIRQGNGHPVVLLHGWPGFWYDWRRVIPTLSKYVDVIAPDFRGFGESSKPNLKPEVGYTPEIFANDILKLCEKLSLSKVILVAHDIGATVAQTIIKLAPDLVESLVLLNPPYPGIGDRRFDATIQGQFWYQHFHNLDMAEKLVSYNSDTVKTYLNHFYNHWVGSNSSFTEYEFDYIVETYSKPDAIRYSLAYYRARSKAKTKSAIDTQKVSKIHTKTSVLWGEKDPVIPAIWSDRIPDYFPNSTITLLPGIGHFVPFESPDSVIKAVLSHLDDNSYY